MSDLSIKDIAPVAEDLAPSLDYLREIVLDGNRDLPLHAQLRTALDRLISDHFADENRFYSESQLISHLRVSQGTVRRALADLASRGRLEKRQARCTIVRKRPAAALQNLAIFLPDYASPHVSKYLNLLHRECLNRNFRMQPIYTHRGEQLLKAYDNLTFSPSEGGVVLLENSPRATSELTGALEDKGYNCVTVGTLPPNSSSKFVGGCNRSMMGIGLEHLVHLGHRRIALLVTEPEEKKSVQERIAAFERCAAESKDSLTATVVRSGMHLWDDSYAVAQRTIEKAMQGDKRPTAIFAISDMGALGSIQWLSKNGYGVPGDVSVMGVDGIDMGAMVHPTLTTLAYPFEEMVEAIFRLLTEKNAEDRQLTFQPVLLVRESTAPPPHYG